MAEIGNLASEQKRGVRARYRLEYGVYQSLKTLARITPEGLRLRLGPILGRMVFRLDSRHRRVALENLRGALPELADRERQILARRCFESLGSVFLEAVASSSLTGDVLRRRFEVEGWRHLETAEAENRGVLLITAHFGNWEALGPCLALNGKPFSFVARPFDNPHIERDYRRIRERLGNRTIPKRGGAREMLRVLRSAGRIAILVDQRVHPNEGKAYPFFGRPAFTTPLPARLSLRTGAPVVPFFAIPIDGWRRYRVVFHPPILPGPHLEESMQAIDALTVRYVAVIEQIIREHPHLWLWMHRRWRKNPSLIAVARAPWGVSHRPTTREADAPAETRSSGSDQAPRALR